MIPLALAVPFSFAMAARNLERIWLLVLLAAVAFDGIVVAAVGDRGAVAVAAVWVAVQVGVGWTTLRLAKANALR
jgi:hypothetical protein